MKNERKVYVIHRVFKGKTQVILFNSNVRRFRSRISLSSVFWWFCFFFIWCYSPWKCLSPKLNSSYSNERLNKSSNPQAINRRRAQTDGNIKRDEKYYECDYYLNISLPSFSLLLSASAHKQPPNTRIKFNVINKIKFY